ncbi:MAG: helix-hairpin-helix domain-containing protein, partial [Actinomycetota bacterium]|nr:helix-hairpin-helix domain-containing protein [Actinomycetota bacterium]
YGPTPSTGVSQGREGVEVPSAAGGMAPSPSSEEFGLSRPSGGVRVSPVPEGGGMSPTMDQPADLSTTPEGAGDVSEGLTVFGGPTSRETREDLAEADETPDFFPDEPVVVPKRTAKTPLSTSPSRTGVEAAVEARSEETPATSTPPVDRRSPGGWEEATAGASVEDARSAAATAEPVESTRSRGGTKKTAARTGERTGARKAAAKATKRATSKKAATAPSGRGAARSPARQDTADATRVVRGQPGRGAGRAGETPAPPAGPAPEVASRGARGSKRAGRGTTEDAARAELAKIKGLGPAKQEALLREFGSLEAIRAASLEQLTAIRGIGETTAREILAQARR